MTVTTAKDSLENLQSFVAANLAGGVDHLIVFLDARDAAVEEWLSTRPEVTVIVCDKSWWQGKRPPSLNLRQRVNSNLARVVLSTVDWVDWLFHVDADEVVWVDRSVLDDVPADRVAVRLLPSEVATGTGDPRGPAAFKRLLEQPELDLLYSLGVLREPTNKLYFRSHIVGKVGLRPRLDHAMRIHNITDSRGKIVHHVQHPDLSVLHYESYDRDEFVRKWQAMIGSGPRIHFGPYRMPIASGLKALLNKKLDPDVTAKYLAEIYQRHMEDRVDVLGDLGLLQHIDPTQDSPTPDRRHPEPTSEAQRVQLREAFERLRGEDKQALSLPEHASARGTSDALERIYGVRPAAVTRTARARVRDFSTRLAAGREGDQREGGEPAADQADDADL
jgi:hypothetical protein